MPIPTDPPLYGEECPLCGHQLVVRINSLTGDEFVGCSQYPQCLYIERDTDELPDDHIWGIDWIWKSD